MATSRPSALSRARYTSPMPPAPSADRISYDPSLSPGPSFKGALSIPSTFQLLEINLSTFFVKSQPRPLLSTVA